MGYDVNEDSPELGALAWFWFSPSFPIIRQPYTWDSGDVATPSLTGLGLLALYTPLLLQIIEPSRWRSY